MFKRIVTLFISIITISAVFAGCNKLATVPNETTPPELTIEEDLVCGFFLTFEKNGEVLTDICSDDFESDDAVKFYIDKKKYEGTNAEYIEIVCGKDALFDCKSSSAVSDKDGVHLVKFEMEAKLYYTYELLDVIMVINPLYMDRKTNKVYVKEGSVLSGHLLSNSVSGAAAGYKEEVATNRTVNGIKEELKYETGIKVSYCYSDYLTGVKVIEYDKNNNLIYSSDIDIKSTEAYEAGTECDYLVLEETYKDKYGDQYVARTLFNRTKEEGSAHTAILKNPLNNGLVEPKSLSIKFN